jgi:hypothetical protein
MGKYQSFSYRLLYEMEPMFISFLHINNENSDRVVWEDANMSNGGSFVNKLLKILNMDLS